MGWEPGTGARSASKERPAAQASPSQQSSLDAIVEQGKAAADPAVRAWGLYHPEVAAFVRKVDRKRVAFVTGLFRDIGFSKVESEARDECWRCT